MEIQVHTFAENSKHTGTQATLIRTNTTQAQLLRKAATMAGQMLAEHPEAKQLQIDIKL